MNWLTLTPQDIYDYLAAPQAQALQQSILATEQDDPLPTLISDICKQVRATLAANPALTLSATVDSIPPELKPATCALIIETAQTRIPGLLLNEDQKQLAREARILLQHAANGRFGITKPDDPESAGIYQTTSGIEVASKRNNPITRQHLRGL